MPSSQARDHDRDHTSRRRRRLVLVLVLALAGTIVNVAVAWGCAFTSPLERRPPGRHVAEHQVHRWTRWAPDGHPPRPTRVFLDTGVGLDRIHMSAVGTRNVTAPAARQEYWTGTEWRLLADAPAGSAVPADRRRLFGLRVLEAGWPCRALHMAQWWDADQEIRRTSGFRIARREIPVAPRWSAFAINTIIYALACRAFLPLPWAALRRRRRLRRGLCVRCPTALEGTLVLVCPRCAWRHTNPRVKVRPRLKPMAIVMMILAGAATSLVVGWTLALAGAPSFGSGRAAISTDEAEWLAARGWTLPEDTDGVEFELEVVAAKRRGAEHRSYTLESDISIDIPPPPGGWSIVGGYDRPSYRDYQPAGYRISAGWPLRCVFGGAVNTAPPPAPGAGPSLPRWELHASVAMPETIGALEVPGGPVLPVGIAWPGLLGNTLVFAAGWWLLGRLPARVRRGLRAGAGACPGCGYALHGLPADRCPECGATLDAPTRPAGATAST